MKVARSISDVLKNHVVLTVEGIDRMYLNVYVPTLQTPEGVAYYLRFHRGNRFASSVLLDPITERFVRGIERHVKRNKIPVVTFEKGQRKDEVAKAALARNGEREGVMFVGKAQEKAAVVRTERRKSVNGGTYPWLVKSTAMVNQYYFYIHDADFGPLFVKFCSYFPYNAKLCINGHEYVKRQLKKQGIAFEALDNGVLSCADPKRLQAICDGLSAEKIDRLLRKIGFQANRRLLDVQKISHDCHLGEAAFQAVNRPTVRDGQRASALRFADPHTQAVFTAAVGFVLQPRGFTRAQIKERIDVLTGRTLSLGRMTYDLRRLRLHGLIQREPKSHRYRLTDAGLRTALFWTRAYARLLRPGMAQLVPVAIADGKLRSTFNAFNNAVDNAVQSLKLVS